MLEQNNNSAEQNKVSPEMDVAAKNATRRGFLKKAAIGAPIVLASSAVPAWGRKGCMTSGQISGNLSDHDHADDEKSGKHPKDLEKNCVGNNENHFEKHQRGMRGRVRYKKQRNGKLTKSRRGDYVLQRWCKDHENEYFCDEKVSSRDNFSGKNHCAHSQISSSGTLHNMLNSSDQFDCHIAAAFVCAQITKMNYCYTPAVVTRLYVKAKEDPQTCRNVTKALQHQHGPRRT